MPQNISKKLLDERHRTIPPDYYDQGIRRDIFQYAWHTPRLSRIIFIVRSFACFGNFLDIGCHSGMVTAAIARAVAATGIGVDISSDAIEYARKRHPSLSFFVADIEKNIPFKDSEFSFITCFDLLEHLPNPRVVIGEVRRVLVEKGYFIIGIPNENRLWKMIWPLWLRMRGSVWTDTHLHEFSRETLSELFDKAGFAKQYDHTMHAGMYRLCVYQKRTQQ